MSNIRNEDTKKNLYLIAKSSNSDEISLVAHLHHTKIGTSTNSKNLDVTGNLSSLGNSVVEGNFSLGGSFAGSTTAILGTAQGRLTLSGSTPVPTSDISTAGVLYYTPYLGSQITLWDGDKWNIINFSETRLSSSLSPNVNADVFAYLSPSKTLSLEIGREWASNNLRYDSLAYTNGVLCKANDPTRRYLGTIRTNGVSFFEDSVSKRFVWNFYNKVDRNLQVFDRANTWTYNSTTFHEANANVDNCWEFVIGDVTYVTAKVNTICSCASSGIGAVTGIGIDSSTVSSAITYGALTSSTAYVPSNCEYTGYPSIGYHKFTWLEKVSSATTVTWYGDNGSPSNFNFGMIGNLLG